MWQTADGILCFFKGVFYVYEWATQFVGLKVKELSQKKKKEARMTSQSVLTPYF